MTTEELDYIKNMATGELWICDNGLCDSVLPLVAEVERLREIVAVNDQRLATLYDEKKQEIDRLRSLLTDAADAIRCGFMDGEWATIVQTQKELLPWNAVVESRKAELVINQINKVLREQKT